jgi:RNase H-fold protein (predicted Holliday junction resolvase)
MPLPVLAIDPGRDKCGLALVDPSGTVLARRLVLRAGLGEAARHLLAGGPVAALVLGDGTGSRRVSEELVSALGEGMPPLALVDERDSTLEARALYFADHPPRGLWRLLPLSLQTPGEPHDDYAAVVLARRYLGL